MLQKLEADIRGHIRLEHEMKIHLDYLEGRVEELENVNIKLTSDKKTLGKRIKELEEKVRGAAEEAERGERRHRETVECLEKEIKDVMGKIKAQQNAAMTSAEYCGEQSLAHDLYKKIHSSAGNSG